MHPLETAAEAAGQSLGQRRLAYSGHAFEQQVSARENRHQGEMDDFVFAANDFAEGVFETFSRSKSKRGGFGRSAGERHDLG